MLQRRKNLFCFFAVISLSACSVDENKDRGFVKNQANLEGQQAASNSSPSNLPAKEIAPFEKNAIGVPAKDGAKNSSAPEIIVSPGVGNSGSGSRPVEPTSACQSSESHQASGTVSAAGGVNVRIEPDSASQRIGGFDDGTKVDVRNSHKLGMEDWSCVSGTAHEGGTITGWVRSDLISRD